MATQPTGPTLSDIAFVARSAIKYGAIFLVVFMVGRIVLNASIAMYKKLNPPKLPPPTMAFGTLPSIDFGADLSSPKEYILQTVTGSLPMLGEQAKVFFVPENKASLLAVEKAQKQAVSLGFVFPYEQVSQKILRWSKTSPMPATLEIDIVTGEVTMKADWSQDPSFFIGKNVPNDSTAITQVKTILRNANLLPSDMATGAAVVTYLKASGGTYMPAVSRSEADFTQVDIYRTPISLKYEIVGAESGKGNARVILSGNQQGERQIVGIEYQHQDVEYESFSTYPLISTSQAWNMLQSGQGHIASKTPSDGSQVIVREVTLGYFDPKPDQLYMQPIYIFKGDKGFVGYVQAATSIVAKQR